MRKPGILLFLALLLCALPFPAFATTGSTVAILRNGTEFEAHFSSAGTVVKIKCDGKDVICNSAYNFCVTYKNQEIFQGAVGHELSGLNPSGTGLGDPKAGKPYYQSGNLKKYLTQTGTENGVPVFDEALQNPPIPDGTEIKIAFDNKLKFTLGLCLHSTWKHVKGTCKLCVLRKLYNVCRVCMTLLGYKEFFKPCHTDGLFTVENGVAQMSFREGGMLCHIFLTNPDQKENTVAGSVAEGTNFNLELADCFLTDLFSDDQETGDRWLEGFFSWGEGFQFCPTVRGKAVEQFINWCIDIQCEPEPPGDPECPPGECCCDPCKCCEDCPPPPGDPGDFPCPEWLNWWLGHQSLWSPIPLTLGTQSYNATEIKTLLTSYGLADVSKYLARELIMAKFNVARGSNPAPISAIIAEADTLLTGYVGKLPYNVSLLTPAGVNMLGLASILQAYNMGKLTPDCIQPNPNPDPPTTPGNPPPPEVCPKTLGYWKTHTSEWGFETLLIGDTQYNKAELLAILNSPSTGDASIILAKQLITTRLNFAAGTEIIPEVLQAADESDALLAPFAGKLPYFVPTGGTVGQNMINKKNVLDNYNNGRLTDCDDTP